MVLMRGVSDAERTGATLSSMSRRGCGLFLFFFQENHLKVHKGLFTPRDVFLKLRILIDSFLQETKNHSQQRGSFLNDQSELSMNELAGLLGR